MIYIIIPVFNRWHFTKPCLESLLKQGYQSFQIIVVDHGSTDGTSHEIAHNYPNVTLIHGDESMWWTAATNLGVIYALKQKDMTHILTLNNDLVVLENYIANMVQLASEHPKALIGSISRSIQNPDKISFAGISWNKWTAKYKPAIPGNNFEKNVTIISDLLPGRGTLVPRDAFETVGIFDEHKFPHYGADEDFSLRCKNNGYDLILHSNLFLLSETEATGLGKSKKNLNYWYKVFFSIKSPVSIKYRWSWAKEHAPVPVSYFLLDMSRVVISKIFKS